MQYLLLIYTDEKQWAKQSEAERSAMLQEYTNFSQSVARSGHLRGGNELHPTSKALTVRVRNKKQALTDGPFAETKELIAGFWLWKVKSKEEAIEWLKRAPFGGGTEVEIRQVFEAEDFGPALTPELRKKEEQLRSSIAKRS